MSFWHKDTLIKFWHCSNEGQNIVVNTGGGKAYDTEAFYTNYSGMIFQKHNTENKSYLQLSALMGRRGKL